MIERLRAYVRAAAAAAAVVDTHSHLRKEQRGGVVSSLSSAMAKSGASSGPPGICPATFYPL